MENNSVKSAILKSIVLLALGAVVIVGLYFMFVGTKKDPGEEQYNLTAVDEITTTNLEKNYPANPRKVVDLYANIMKVLYKEEYTDGQQDKMLEVLHGIMDDELLANQTDFYDSMKKEVVKSKEEGYIISKYVIQNEEPEVVTVSGKNMCNVGCTFRLLKKGSGGFPNYYQFILRQDDDKKWKILGWDVITNE